MIETTSERRGNEGELWPSGDSRIYTQAAVGQHTISSYALKFRHSREALARPYICMAPLRSRVTTQ